MNACIRRSFLRKSGSLAIAVWSLSCPMPAAASFAYSGECALYNTRVFAPCRDNRSGTSTVAVTFSGGDSGSFAGAGGDRPSSASAIYSGSAGTAALRVAATMDIRTEPIPFPTDDPIQFSAFNAATAAVSVSWFDRIVAFDAALPPGAAMTVGFGIPVTGFNEGGGYDEGDRYGVYAPFSMDTAWSFNGSTGHYGFVDVDRDDGDFGVHTGSFIVSNGQAFDASQSLMMFAETYLRAEIFTFFGEQHTHDLGYATGLFFTSESGRTTFVGESGHDYRLGGTAVPEPYTPGLVAVGLLALRLRRLASRKARTSMEAE